MREGKGRECTVSSAVVTAVAVCLWCAEVGADLLGRTPEIVDGAGLIGEDVTCRNKNGVCVNALAGVWQPERVVQCEVCLVVGKAVQIPVCLS